METGGNWLVTGLILQGKALAARHTRAYYVLPSTSEDTKATFCITGAASSLLSDVRQLFYLGGSDMNQSANEKQCSGVLCLFCGMFTQVPSAASEREHSKSGVHTSLIRCEQCGKEARYLPNEVKDIQETDRAGMSRARAAGVN